jgi:tRNA dimethylallyltransferase
MAVELALRHNGEVVSADSMQIYRTLDIGTAKPTQEEMQGVPHHMLDVAEPDEDFSVARYVEMASACVDDILARGKLPILAGGTGLYIDSLLSGRKFAAFSTESPLRGELQERAKLQGSETLWQELKGIDPEAAQRLHPNDEKRIIRALEVWYQTGMTITEHNRLTQAIPPRYEAMTLGLAFEQREDMWNRIDCRVDEMMAQGLVEEVRSVLERGIPASCTAMQAIGYKEMVQAVQNNGNVLAAAEEVKLRSRQYAKRQLTWFRRNQATCWHRWGKKPDFQQALRASTEYMREFGLV